MQILTVPNKNDCFARIVLEGEEYLFRFSYNFSGKFWTIGIYEDRDKPLVAGIKIVPNFPLNQSFGQYLDLPNGLLLAKTHKEKIKRYDFYDGNAELVYITSDELKEWAK